MVAVQTTFHSLDYPASDPIPLMGDVPHKGPDLPPTIEARGTAHSPPCFAYNKPEGIGPGPEIFRC